jgi:xanthosine utilization system XapX-like protein
MVTDMVEELSADVLASSFRNPEGVRCLIGGCAICAGWRLIGEDAICAGWRLIGEDAICAGWRLIGEDAICAGWRLIEGCAICAGWCLIGSSSLSGWLVVCDEASAAEMIYKRADKYIDITF